MSKLSSLAQNRENITPLLNPPRLTNNDIWFFLREKVPNIAYHVAIFAVHAFGYYTMDDMD